MSILKEIKKLLFPSKNSLDSIHAYNLKYGDDEAKKFTIYHTSPVVKKHYFFLNKIEEAYKIGNSFEDKFNYKYQECIDLCKKDIEISKLFMELCKSTDQPIPGYTAFKRLAMIYDKQGNYDSAVEVCTQSLVLGYDKDDMCNRLARMLKKQGIKTFEQQIADYNIKL